VTDVTAKTDQQRGTRNAKHICIVTRPTVLLSAEKVSQNYKIPLDSYYFRTRGIFSILYEQKPYGLSCGKIKKNYRYCKHDRWKANKAEVPTFGVLVTELSLSSRGRMTLGVGEIF
jgi:hypothetical protein